MSAPQARDFALQQAQNGANVSDTNGNGGAGSGNNNGSRSSSSSSGTRQTTQHYAAASENPALSQSDAYARSHRPSIEDNRTASAQPPHAHAVSNNYAWPTSMSQRSIASIATHQRSPRPEQHSLAGGHPTGVARRDAASPLAHSSAPNDGEGSAGPSGSQHSTYGATHADLYSRHASREHYKAGSPARGAHHQQQPSQASTLMASAGANASRTEFHALPTITTRQPLQSRVFGLGTDMRPQTELVDPAFFPGGVVPAEAATLAGSTDSSKLQPTFSVELKASSFDQRGYPVYSGRAATIRGAVRVRKADSCEVAIKISAYTTSGSAAAVWDGVALQPPESGSERTVFQTMEKVTPTDGKVEYPHRHDADGNGARSEEDAVLVMPFHCNLPMGGSTRVVDGNVETVAVALPPSFEMSSEQDARDKAVLRNTVAVGGGATGPTGLMSGAASIKTSRTKMTAMTLRDAVETGLQQVYRVGCFYRITFTLLRKKAPERERKGSAALFGKKNKSALSPSSSSTNLTGSSNSSKKSKGSDTLSIPFVFLGEPTNLPLPPSSLPPIRPQILLQPSSPLAHGWGSESATAKWSGMLFKTLKRNVELEMFLPEDRIIQAPSIIPILVVIRPEDPEMLPQPGAVIFGNGPPHSNGGSPRTGLLADAGDLAYHSSDGSGDALGLTSSSAGMSSSSPLASPLMGSGQQAHHQQRDAQADDYGGDNDTLRGDASSTHTASASSGNALTRLIRTSLSISRQSTRETTSTAATPASASAFGSSNGHKQVKKKSSRSTFTFGRRPNTAPSQGSSDGSPANTEISYTVRGGGGSSSGASGSRLDLPGLVRVSLLQNIYYSSSSVNEPPKNKRRLVSVADMEEMDLSKLLEGRSPSDGPDCVAQVEEARQRGVRVLRGLIKVGREATPSFRVQGIELKYAIKVDLLPFNPRGGKAAKYHASSPPRTPPNRPSMQSAFGAASVYGGGPLTRAPSTAGGSGSGSGSGSGPSARVSSGGGGGAATRFSASNPLHSASPSVSSSQWSPSGQSHGHRHLQQHIQAQGHASQHHEGGGMGGSHSTRDVASLYQGQSSIAGTHDMSEAGWTRRSPSDQTVLGPDASKLQKTVGALWVNVRLVKGRTAL
ncbi:unnamed protein product [Parajaminaea phylloscopi]